MKIKISDIQGMLNCLNAFTADNSARQWALLVDAQTTLLVSAGPNGAFGFQPVRTAVAVNPPVRTMGTEDATDEPVAEAHTDDPVADNVAALVPAEPAPAPAEVPVEIAPEPVATVAAAPETVAPVTSEVTDGQN